jgi:hypothetical protein
VSSPWFGFGSISAGIRGRFALFNFKMDPFSGQGLGLGSARGWVAARAQLVVRGRFGWVGWVGESVGWFGSVGSVALGRVPSNGVGLQVIRSGRLGELLRGRGRIVKGWGVPNN